MMKQVASCLLSAKLCYELNPQVKQPQLVFNPPPAASHVQNPAEKPREFQSEVQPQAYVGEEDQLRPSSPLVCLGKLWSPSLNKVWSFASPILSIQSLGPFSFVQEELKSCPSQFQDCSLGHEDTMMGYLPGDRVLHDHAVSDCPYRTFDNDGDANSLVSVNLRRETLKSFGRKERPTSGSILLSLQRSYDQTPVHMPLSLDPYFMDIEVDVVHDSPVHGDHPAAPASPAANFPPAPAAPIPAAQPGPAPTDPAIIALLELMAEMVNLQHQALNAQLEFHRLADLVERAVNVEEAIVAERASSSHSAQPRRPSVQSQPQPHSPMPRGRGGEIFRPWDSSNRLYHVRRDCPTVGQFQPAVPSHITCFTCGERGRYATSCPHTHLAQPVVTSAQPVVPVNPPLPLPPAKHQATACRAYALELPGPSGPPQGPISGLFS
ncbi:hypothetical protein IGI04_036037 [Brassica rapa subsp. trilocularis]|uniref:CCHC-type domain-containing protein n=1 Tax=Brassica rapa subsp. trilocularis TaxID=1813537 RepID=A0ABQ7LEA2_BRACM|nr:hypothetical protein IGI04_036037 [Brassica rapa subsp. trilocularis]